MILKFIEEVRMETSYQAPGTLSLLLLFLYAGCEPPPLPESKEIDSMH